MNSQHKMIALVRREVWENRSLWIVPLVVSAVMLLSSAFGQIHVGGGFKSAWFFFGDSAHHDTATGQASGGADKVYGAVIMIFTMLQMAVFGIGVIFYLLDALLGERKDRSILFWKSLPISDAQVVGSKVLTGLVAAPIFVLLVSAVTQLLFGLVLWLRFGGSSITQAIAPFDASMWLNVQAASWLLSFTIIAWYLPIAGYLLLVSVWARKNAFLWAVLPPIGILAVEGMFTPFHVFKEFLAKRFDGVYLLIGQEVEHVRLPGSDDVNSIGELLAVIGRVFTHYEMWVSILVAAAMFLAVVRIRRYRDDA